MGAIATSFEKFGVYQPIVAQRSSGHVIAGNHRLHAARKLGHKTLPVVWLDVDDRTARAILVGDNRLSDLATYDEAALVEVLRQLAGEDALEGTGYDGDDVDALIARLEGVPVEGDNSGNLPGGIAVIVDCESEEQQLALIEELMGRGLTCRAAVL